MRRERKILQDFATGLSLNFDNFRANPMNFHKVLLDCHIKYTPLKIEKMGWKRGGGLRILRKRVGTVSQNRENGAGRGGVGLLRNF